MLYFVRLSNSYSHSNRLQEAIWKRLPREAGALVEDPEGFRASLQGIVDELNAQYPRCTPAQVRMWDGAANNRDSDKTIYVSIPNRSNPHDGYGLFEFRLHRVRPDSEEAFRKSLTVQKRGVARETKRTTSAHQFEVQRSIFDLAPDH